MTGYDNAHVRFWFVEHFGQHLRLHGSRAREGKPSAEKTPQADQEAPGREAQKTAPAPNDQEAAKCAPGNGSNSAGPEEPLKPLRFWLNLEPDVDYLRDRGVTEETVRRYGLGLCRRGLLAGYVCIPVFRWPREDGENPVAYLGRWPGDDESADRPRYKWPDGFPKSRVVYGLAEALAGTEGEPLVVVEGPFKVYHLVQAGLPGAVAIFGSSLSDDQADLLAGTGRPIVLMFDGDDAGQAGMRLAAAKLICRAFVRVVRLEPGQEPDSLTADELQGLLSFVNPNP